MSEPAGPSSQHSPSPSNAPQPRNLIVEAVVAPSATADAVALQRLVGSERGDHGLSQAPGVRGAQTVLALQRTVGNVATQRILQQWTSDEQGHLRTAIIKQPSPPD